LMFNHDLPIGAYLDAGDIIGYRKDGRPIFLQAGGAAGIDVAEWIPEEWDSNVIMRVTQMSAVEARANRIPMRNDVKHVPRSSGVGVESVAKGGTYGEDLSANDSILLTARKIGKIIRIDQEDLLDSTAVNIINTKKVDWATSYAKFLDNATLAVTGTENGTTVPFTSLYKSLRTTNSDTAYTADTNRIAHSTFGTDGADYPVLSNLLGLVEEGDYWSEGDMWIIAHPAFRAVLRNVKDDNGTPIFVRGQGGDAGTPDTLFDLPIHYSLGARTSPTATDSPAGNKLMFVGNMRYLDLGIRSGPESAAAGADTGPAFTSDQHLLKMRSRRGFATAHEKAFAVLEKTG
jgi:HK97 family phage major capsid protein